MVWDFHWVDFFLVYLNSCLEVKHTKNPRTLCHQHHIPKIPKSILCQTLAIHFCQVSLLTRQMLTSQIMSISVWLIKNCFAVNSLCCLVHILVCLYYQCVQINWPAALLAVLQPLNSSLAIGHNPVVHSLLRQITNMASLHQKKKERNFGRLITFSFSSVLLSSLCPVHPRLKDWSNTMLTLFTKG